jgi:hypothetical protein
MAKSRQDRRKSSDDLPTGPSGGQGDTKDGDGPSPHKKIRLSFDGLTSTMTQVALRPGQASTVSPLVMPGFQTAGGARSTATNEQSSSGVLQNVDDEPDNGSGGIDSNSTPADSDIPPMDEYERMRSERNIVNPLDCSTDFGKYLTIHTVVKHFNDPFEIQRLFAQTPTSPGGAADVAADQTRLWHDELEAIAKKQRFILRAATEDEISKQSQLEQYFNNPKFQRLNYAQACTYLNILDPTRPQFSGMATTMVFKSWQVPSIYALMQFEQDLDFDSRYCFVQLPATPGLTTPTACSIKPANSSRAQLSFSPSFLAPRQQRSPLGPWPQSPTPATWRTLHGPTGKANARSSF